MANLFLFTSYFPYGVSGESFIESEIKYACENFDTVYIIPTQNTGTPRPIPDNAKIIESKIYNNKDYLKYGIKKRAMSLRKIFSEFWRLKAFTSVRKLRKFIVELLVINSLKNSKQLQEVLKIVTSKDVVYSYWGYGWGYILPLTDFNGAKIISRFHGGDLYEYRPNVMLPLRRELLNKIDLAVYISKDGQQYSQDMYPGVRAKSIVSYLGTLDSGCTFKSNDKKFRIVSCSYLKPVKRVDLIFKALLLNDDPDIEWTHIGGGELFNQLKELIHKTPHKFKITLTGHLPNYEVKNLLKDGGYDVFINVSSSEGLPVSLMEAISFNIPVIGTDVGGTREIVNESTGVLIPADPSLEDITSAINELKDKTLNPRKFWEENFNADTNYKKFYKLLKQL